MLEQSFSNYQLLSFKIHFRDLPGFTVFTGLKTSLSVFPESHVQYLYDELQMSQFMPTPECDWRDYCQETASLPEMPFTQCPCPPRSLPWQTPTMENGTTLHAWTGVAASVSHVWVNLSCSCVCRVPAQSLHLLVQSCWQPAIAVCPGSQYKICRGTLRWKKTSKA